MDVDPAATDLIVNEICDIFAKTGLLELSKHYNTYQPDTWADRCGEGAYWETMPPWQRRLHDLLQSYFGMGVPPPKAANPTLRLETLGVRATELICKLSHSVHVAIVLLFIMCNDCCDDQNTVDEDLHISLVINAILQQDLPNMLPDDFTISRILQGTHFTAEVNVGGKIVCALFVLCNVFVFFQYGHDLRDTVHRYADACPSTQPYLESNPNVLYTNYIEPTYRDNVWVDGHAPIYCAVTNLVLGEMSVLLKFYRMLSVNYDHAPEEHDMPLYDFVQKIKNLQDAKNFDLAQPFDTFLGYLDFRIQNVLFKTSFHVFILFIAIIRQCRTCTQTGSPVPSDIDAGIHQVCPEIQDEYVDFRFENRDLGWCQTRMQENIDIATQQCVGLSGEQLKQWCLDKLLDRNTMTFFVDPEVDRILSLRQPDENVVQITCDLFTGYTYGENSIEIARWNPTVNDTKDAYKQALHPYMQYLSFLHIIPEEAIIPAQNITLTSRYYNTERARKCGWVLA